MLQAELRALGSSGRRQATAQCPGDSEDHTSTAEVRAPALSTPHASQSSVRAAARLSRREGRGCSVPSDTGNAPLLPLGGTRRPCRPPSLKSPKGVIFSSDSIAAQGVGARQAPETGSPGHFCRSAGDCPRALPRQTPCPDLPVPKSGSSLVICAQGPLPLNFPVRSGPSAPSLHIHNSYLAG